MSSIIKTAGTVAASALLILGASGCSGQAAADTEPKETQKTAPVNKQKQDDQPDQSKKTAAEAAAVIEEFFAAATSDVVAADLPDQATGETFAEAVSFASSTADSDRLTDAVTELALLKLDAPKKDLVLEVDESAVQIDGDTATVPVKALTITSGGKNVKDAGAVATQINDLVFVDGSWALTFPDESKDASGKSESK